jgi:surface protein
MLVSVLSLSLSLSGHGVFRCDVLLNVYDNSRFATSQVSHVLIFFFVCGLKRDLVVGVCVGFGLSLFFVAPFSLLAVFESASVFNQDVSTWNTGAVTNMQQSKYTLSPSLWPRRLPLWCGVEYLYGSSRFVGSQVSHVLFSPFFFKKCSTTVASHEHSAVAHGNP